MDYDAHKKRGKWSEAQVTRYMVWNARFLHRYRRLGPEALELRLGDIVLTAELTGDKGVDMTTAATALGMSRQTGRTMVNKWVRTGRYVLEKQGRSTLIKLTPARRKEALKRARGMIDTMFDCIDDIITVE